MSRDEWSAMFRHPTSARTARADAERCDMPAAGTIVVAHRP